MLKLNLNNVTLYAHGYNGIGKKKTMSMIIKWPNFNNNVSQ